ncbi:MAG: RluA family pseudouridine synthase, partial [Paludibacteraceae bacterium]|nr:RluA family pseudouridine synthase [Paludibacteraceae bacterium]
MEEYAESILEDEVERYEHYRFTADPGQTLIRVDKFLTDRITGASRSRVQQSADAGNVEVNGEPQKSSYKVKPGDVVTVMMSYPPKDTSIIPEDIPLDIVYEDDELLVVNKPAGMVVHPGHGNFQGTLLNALAWHFGERKPFEAGDDRLGLVHRIDKDTSGLLVIAKTPRSKADLSAQFFNKTT